MLVKRIKVASNSPGEQRDILTDNSLRGIFQLSLGEGYTKNALLPRDCEGLQGQCPQYQRYPHYGPSEYLIMDYVKK